MGLYLDTPPVIYLVERNPFFVHAVQTRLSDPALAIYSSHLTRMECRVKPIKEQNQKTLNDFEFFFTRIVAHLLPLSEEVMDKAAEIRANYGFKTPDAIHLAAAVIARCDTFLTNDRRLDRFTGIPVEVV